MDPNMSDSRSTASDFGLNIEEILPQLTNLKGQIDKKNTLLSKARSTIQQYKLKIDDLEQEVAQAHARYEQMSIESAKAREIPGILGVLCRVEVDSDIWTCIRTDRSTTEWFTETILSLGEFELPDVLKQQEFDDQSANLTNLTEQAEQFEKKYKMCNKAFEEKSAELEELVKVLRESRIIHDSISVFLEKDDESKLNSVEKDLVRFSHLTESSSFKDHLLKVHKACMDLTKRLIHMRKEMSASDTAWRAACDSLMNEKEELRSTVARLRQEALRFSQDHLLEIDSLKASQLREMSEKDNELEEMRFEVKKCINVPYLKQAIVQFLSTGEQDVQDRLLNVIMTVLTFNEEEMAEVKIQRSKKGMLGRFLSFGN